MPVSWFKKIKRDPISDFSRPVEISSVSVLNCLTGEIILLSKPVTTIGSSPSCDIILGGFGVLPEHCRIERKNGAVQIERISPDATLFVDGDAQESIRLWTGDELFSLQIGAHHFLLLGVNKGTDELHRLDYRKWKYAEKLNGAVEQQEGPFTLKEILDSSEVASLSRDKTILFIQGSTIGFRLSQFLGEPTVGANGFTGEFQCPRCWLRFDLTDILYIAAHHDLLGDPVLGEDEMQRFRATEFLNGRPVDPKGVPCSETACPHCRGRLPHGFVDLPLNVFSVVGISAAGKSYYLALLIDRLKRFLVQNFSVTLMDSDGGENRALNDMTQKLTSAATPQEAILDKTQQRGVTYKRFTRFGKDVHLPQPFVYTVTPRDKKPSLLIVYDDAGELFLPDNSENAETTEHIAYSDTIFFLFDPVRHREFHHLIREVEDPQVSTAWKENRKTFVQDIVLGEIQRRIQSSLNLRAGTSSDKPFAFIVGKYDLWHHLLPESDLRTDFVVNRKLNLAAIDFNSDKVREFMLRNCPDIVGCAEAISSNVKYFPVSTFGSHAVHLSADKNAIGPDPEKLQPRFLEIPTIWALSKALPDVIAVS